MVTAHVASGLFALLAGGLVVLTRKGTTQHRRLGWCYTAAMVALLATSFGIRAVSGSPTVFHGVSIASTAVLLAGLSVPVFLRDQVTNWLAWHVRLMLTSYLMLVVTMAAQFFDVLPLPHPALNAIVFLQVPTLAGFVLIARAAHRATVPARQRRDAAIN
jgi:uncharacterized membrane protein